MALYVEKSDGTYFLDEDGNKIEYTVEYDNIDLLTIDNDFEITINDDLHLETKSHLMLLSNHR